MKRKTKNKKAKTEKFRSALIGASIPLLLIFAVFFSSKLTFNKKSILSSSIQPTITIDLYSNKELGLSFKYPINWRIKSYSTNNKEEGVANLSVAIYPKIYDKNDYPPIELVYYNNYEELPLQKYIQKYFEGNGVGPNLYVDSEPIIISEGIKAYYQQNSNYCKPLICQSYIFLYKNKIFQLISHSNKTNNQNIVFDGIFKSIQLIK